MNPIEEIEKLPNITPYIEYFQRAKQRKWYGEICLNEDKNGNKYHQTLVYFDPEFVRDICKKLSIELDKKLHWAAKFNGLLKED